MTNRLLISLSGGGFRSALFNAGVLRVLHEKGLLDVSTDIRPRNVIVSAVSGGSIPAALWDRFLKSEQFQLSPKALLPESELLRLVTTCPKLLGKLNWHLRGWGIFAQRSWRQFLSKWWETISLTPYDPKFFSASGPFIVPGDSQYFPTFVLETLDFNSGDVVMYCNGEYFKPNVEFFKNGNVGIVREKYSYPHGIVSATSFPAFFPSVKLNNHQLIDAGLIDNQAIFSFLPILSVDGGQLLGPDDVWYLSDAGRSMSVAGAPEDDLGAGSQPVKRLSFFDRLFRLTGDLSQPIVQDVLTKLVSLGLGAEVVGIKMSHTSHGHELWLQGEKIKSPQASATAETSLCGMARDDALAIISHGAQCATIAFELDETVQEEMIDRLTELKQQS